jgi:hypothetical protein
MRSIHPITKAITLTLEVQGLQAYALQGFKNHGRYIAEVDTRPDSAGYMMANDTTGIVKALLSGLKEKNTGYCIARKIL